ncbi:hypothetical protein CMI37_25105 [Candidatus Pacearchaeota archaeon]|nr:hypothetical protein [Candidatus Pacearchaeota archaeon]|tara:strand:- start:5913 stop:6797 length:885 start_codon:yes stop_codon:yes gene_type:complete
MRGLTHSIRQATQYADYFALGLSPNEHRIHKEYKNTAMLFGIDVAQRKRKEARHEESLENANLSYDFDGMEVYNMKSYHADCKKWLDIIEHFDMPIQVESAIGKTTYHDGDFNWKSDEGRVWRFRDLETKYSMDFSTGKRDLTNEEKGHINGNLAHVKFIWALPEDQGNYYRVNKSLRRFSKILFIDGYDYLEGWASRINQMPVRKGRDKNWRARKVKMKDNKGNLSKNNGIALLAMWLRCGFMIVGDKKDDRLIAYISPLLYRYITKDDPHALDDELKYARNKSYDINTTYEV